MNLVVTRCHCVCNSLNLSCGCYCGGSFRFDVDGPIANGGDDVGACIYLSRFPPRTIGLNYDGLKKGSVMIFFLPGLLLSYYWSMRIGFATREKQPMANPTVKLLFLHSGCCFELVRTPPWWPRHQQLHPGSWSAEAPQIWLTESWMHATMRNWAWFMGRGRMESYIYIIYLYFDRWLGYVVLCV